MTTDREHLDAETVAAWIDGGLDKASLAAAEAHASNCERCQALLASVSQTLPIDGAAASSQRTRNIFGSWKWLMPLAATAAAVTIWMVVPQERMQPDRTAAPQSDVAQAPAAPSPVVPIAPPVIPERAARVAPRVSSEAQSAEARRAAPRQEGEAKEKLADAQATPAGSDAFGDRQLKREEARAEVAAATPPPPPAPAAAAPAEPARDTTATGANLGAVAQSRLQKQSGPLQIVAPDTQRRWRVLPDMIEHSQDGGRTWIPVRLTAGDVITAGTAPSSQVCWFVGARGLVLLATDGTNFTRLPFPERVDLVSVTAGDARRATVTAADGRTFQTDDNGRNWRNP